MKSKIVQEFKGYINNVPFDNQEIYYSAEYILNEIEDTFDIEFGRHSEYEPTGKNKDGDIETMKDEIKQLKLMVHNLMFGGK